VPGLVDRVLTFTENSGQRGERVGSLPQVAGIRIGTAGKQQPRHLQRGVAGGGAVQAGVGEVEQRLPVVRSARSAGLRRVIRQQGRGGRDVPDGGHRVDAGGGDVRVGGKQLARPLPPGRVVTAVGQAGQPEELPGASAFGGHRAASWCPVRRARVPGNDLHVAAQFRPAAEAVLAGDHQLRVCQRDGRQRLDVSAGEAWMELPDQLACGAVADEHPPSQDLRLVSQVLEIRLTGKFTGRHDGLLLLMPGVRMIRHWLICARRGADTRPRGAANIRRDLARRRRSATVHPL